MRQIIYISTAPSSTTDKAVEAILASSRRNNRRDGITGLLISDGTRFLQALEGEEAAVDAVYARIKADTRHRAAVVLSSKLIEQRQFGFWDMAFRSYSNTEDDASLGDVVNRLVAHVADRNVQALFSGFARIDRARIP